MKKIKIGVVGCGYWGPNLIRNFNDNMHTDVVYACDLNIERLQNIKLKYPHINITTDYKDILKDDNIQAVAIATPVSSHFELVYASLEAGKHVLVEKPFTNSLKDGMKLLEMAEKKGLTILVDHTFIYTDAVKKIKDYISRGELGEMYYFDSVRVNLGLFQHDINVVWDLAAHDLSIMDYLISRVPTSVTAVGVSHTKNNIEDIAYVTLKFSEDLIAHFHVNWLSPVKVRRITIGGSKKMIVYDDMETSEKVKIYDKGIIVSKGDKNSLYNALIQYRIGDMFSPKIEATEAVKTEIDHFVDCLRNNKKPITDGESGLRVVRILEAAENSIRKGHEIKL